MSYVVCPECGRLMNPAYGYEVCAKCRVNDKRRRYRQKHTSSFRGRSGTARAVCKRCHKKFTVQRDRDPRWCYWCDACRQIIRKIEICEKLTPLLNPQKPHLLPR